MDARVVGIKMSEHDVDKIKKFVQDGISLNISDFVRQATREKIEKIERKLE